MFATDVALNVVDEVDKNNSAATRSSARTSFQEEFGKEARRQHSGRFQNTRQRTPKQMKQQIRAEFEFGVHISWGEAEVCAPFDSYDKMCSMISWQIMEGGCKYVCTDKKVGERYWQNDKELF